MISLSFFPEDGRINFYPEFPDEIPRILSFEGKIIKNLKVRGGAVYGVLTNDDKKK